MPHLVKKTTTHTWSAKLPSRSTAQDNRCLIRMGGENEQKFDIQEIQNLENLTLDDLLAIKDIIMEIHQDLRGPKQAPRN